jgi:hypothetical protein
VTVRLEELGSLRGRVVDARGRPLAGLTVAVEVFGRPPGYGDFPWTDLYEGGLARQLKRRARTDSEGKFRLGGLIPGLPYELLVSKGEVTRENPAVLCYRNKLLVESGKVNDLGDLKSHPVRGEKNKLP